MGRLLPEGIQKGHKFFKPCLPLTAASLLEIYQLMKYLVVHNVLHVIGNNSYSTYSYITVSFLFLDTKNLLP